MFTGIVQAVGVLDAAEATASGLRLAIDPGAWSDHRASPGDSICVAGVCLTVAEDPASAGGRLVFDVIPETLERTTLGGRGVGSKLNLERSMTADTLMGGHTVQGHVDAVGEVVSVETEGQWRTRVRAPADFMPFVVPKGSVAIEGVSLTVAAVDPAGGWFEVALIPETLARTTLQAALAGTRVNLESDVMARTIVHYLRHFAGGSAGGVGG